MQKAQTDPPSHPPRGNYLVATFIFKLCFADHGTETTPPVTDYLLDSVLRKKSTLRLIFTH